MKCSFLKIDPQKDIHGFKAVKLVELTLAQPQSNESPKIDGGGGGVECGGGVNNVEGNLETMQEWV